MNTQDWQAAYDSGVKAGQEQAWGLAIKMIKSATATAYILGGDTREAKQLRELANKMLQAAGENR